MTVTDCNDEAPLFQPSDSYEFAISESSTVVSINTVVFSNISTSDEDLDAANRAVRYELRNGVTSTNNWFDIDPSSVRLCDQPP